MSHAEGTDRAQAVGWNVPVELLAENEEASVAASEGAREGPWQRGQRGTGKVQTGKRLKGHHSFYSEWDENERGL